MARDDCAVREAARALDRVSAQFQLSENAAGQLHALLVLVSSDPHAPTTVRDPVAIAHDHVADSLVALQVPAVRSASAIADIGSGAGFPGLPLAIARPDAWVALIESSARKCAFLERAIDVCGATNAAVVHARVEEVARRASGAAPRYDVVTARALAPLAVVAEYAAPLLNTGGSLVAWRGQRDPEDERAAEEAADELGLEVLEPAHVRPYSGAENRHLHLLVKLHETPARFPRRPGMARKRPLGGSSDRERR